MTKDRLPPPSWRPPVHGPINGNIFAVLAAATTVLRREGKREYADELKARLFGGECRSYDAALLLIQEYVELNP